MKKSTQNLLTWLIVIIVVIVTTIVTQLCLFGFNKQKPQRIEASQAVSEKIEDSQAVSKKIGTWSNNDTYVKGDRVIFKGKVYEAKWWTKGEQPDLCDEWGVWKVVVSGNISYDNHIFPFKAGVQSFKVVGYYPDWQADKINRIQYDKLTHINYAFAIPREDGSLRPLKNPEIAEAIIAKAHKYGVKVSLAVGGWSYKDIPLKTTFEAATATDDKCKKFATNIIAMAKEYGFDGVDIDWEYPRNGEVSENQYVKLMIYLSEGLKEENMLLTVAVLPGKTVDGTVQYDAAVYSDGIIDSVDWINVMAYDGGDGDKHSSYNYAIECASYWKDMRKVPAHKIVLGVPFYGRPSWLTYDEILKIDSGAADKDVALIDGSRVCYNGISTIKKKAQWAFDHVGGIMIWEISQDTADQEQSLLNAIDISIKE